MKGVGSSDLSVRCPRVRLPPPHRTEVVVQTGEMMRTSRAHQ